MADNLPLPSAFEVSRMHIFKVVGRHVKISKPSSRGAGRNPGKRKSIPLVIGRPTKNGHAPKVIVWMRLFNFMLTAAFALF
jgi:hypothetical protein